MPKFRITLCRAVYEYADVDIEADDVDAAQVQAIALAEARRIKGWEQGGDEDTEPAKAINAEDLP